MSRTHKAFMLAMLAFAALFAGFLILGEKNDSERARANANNYAAPPWLTRLGELLQSRTPRIGLPGPLLTIAPGVSLEFGVAPADNGFRSAKLILQQGFAVDIEYVDWTEEGPGQLREQRVRLPREAGSDSMQTTIVAMKHGGRLTLHCHGTIPCVLKTR
jgi:hypothetical protein